MKPAWTREEFEIGRILHLKSEIRNLKLDCIGAERRAADLVFGGTLTMQVGMHCPVRELLPVQFEISDFGFEMQDSSDSNPIRQVC